MSDELRLQERIEEAEKTAASPRLTEEEQLIERYREAQSLERRAKAIKEELKPQIEELLNDGVRITDGFSELKYQESVTYKADIDKLAKALGPDVALRCAEVSSAKIRKLLEIGFLKAEEIGELVKEVKAKKIVNAAIKKS